MSHGFRASTPPPHVGLFLSAPRRDGGSFQYSLALLQALQEAEAKHGWKLTVAVAHTDWNLFLSRKNTQILHLKRAHLFSPVTRRWESYRKFPLEMWRQSARFLSPAYRKMKALRCDLWIYPNQDKWSYALPLPSLGVVHDLMHRYESRFPEVGERQEVVWRDWHYAALGKFASEILVDSEIGKRQLKESFKNLRSPISVLPYISLLASNVLKTGHLPPPPSSVPEKFFFYPAQFWKHKNHLILLKAAALLKQRGLAKVHFVFVGSRRNGLRDLEQYIDEHALQSQVTILDFVDETTLASLYRSARALVMPTFFGPTNIPPLEAFQFGCPVAVSKIYGMPEQLGEAALYFDQENAEEIATLLQRLWTDNALCAHLKERGHEHSKSWGKPQFQEKFLEIVHNRVTSLRLKGAECSSTPSFLS